MTLNIGEVTGTLVGARVEPWHPLVGEGGGVPTGGLRLGKYSSAQPVCGQTLSRDSTADQNAGGKRKQKGGGSQQQGSASP